MKRRKENAKNKSPICYIYSNYARIMIFIMTLYNTVFASGSFINFTFLIALKRMWIEFIIIFLCAFFISSPIAIKFAFRIVMPGDRPIFIIFKIQIFTVVVRLHLQVCWPYIMVTDLLRSLFQIIWRLIAVTLLWHYLFSCLLQVRSQEVCSGWYLSPKKPHKKNNHKMTLIHTINAFSPEFNRN